jgi:hypothetical protein
MSFLFRCLLGAALLQFAMLPNATAQIRRQMPFLDWRTFTVPEYGTEIEYPAAVFVPAGAPERAWVSDSRAPTVALSFPFTPAKTSLAIRPQAT